MLIGIARRACARMGRNRRIVILSRPVAGGATADTLRDRLAYYLPGIPPAKLHVHSSWPWAAVLSFEPVLIARELPGWESILPRLLPNCFHTDQRSNPKDGWEWVRAFNYHTGHRPDIRSSRSRFAARIAGLKRLGLKRSYVFGTGPSLERTAGRDWSDGYRIVSNTIVRDAALWHHLKPHIIVAGDAIYHFGHTAFARAFRRDLAARLAETDTLFVYPAVFDGLVQREFKPYSSRLVAVPSGVHQHLEVDLCREFSLPNLGNVLPLLLLPIGCTLSKSVCLWGFDGRAPTDRLFWANSGKHTYPELMPALREAHPKFFENYTPKNDPGWYVKHYHGDLLDRRLTTAENGGFRFSMLHPSWTATLQKRYADS